VSEERKKIPQRRRANPGDVTVGWMPFIDDQARTYYVSFQYNVQTYYPPWETKYNVRPPLASISPASLPSHLLAHSPRSHSPCFSHLLKPSSHRCIPRPFPLTPVCAGFRSVECGARECDGVDPGQERVLVVLGKPPFLLRNMTRGRVGGSFTH
jgi:hypothetical protein